MNGDPDGENSKMKRDGDEDRASKYWQAQVQARAGTVCGSGLSQQDETRATQPFDVRSS